MGKAAKGKGKPKAKVKTQRPPKGQRTGRDAEFQKRSLERKLEAEPEDSLAKKTWAMVRVGKLMSDRRSEFMAKYTQTGDFRFVSGLKWNVHLDTDEHGQKRGYLTEAMILKLEAGNAASTKSVIAHAKAQGHVMRDEVRNTNLYWYDGIAYEKSKNILTKGIRTDMQTGNVGLYGTPIHALPEPEQSSIGTASIVATTPKARGCIGPLPTPLKAEPQDDDDHNMQAAKDDMQHDVEKTEHDVEKTDEDTDNEEGEDEKGVTESESCPDAQPAQESFPELEARDNDDTDNEHIPNRNEMQIDADEVIEQVKIFMEGCEEEPYSLYLGPFRHTLILRSRNCDMQLP